MDSEDWLTEIKNAKKTCALQSNTRKVHFLFSNKNEMVEEYNMDTDVLTRRAWKIKNELGSEGGWEVEIGDPEPKTLNAVSSVISESNNQPFVSRRITKNNLEWRIRNLTYPIDVYSVTADANENCIIVRTSNKKYYKKLQVPELKRVGLVPEQKNIEFTHKYNTLIITYKKPEKVVNLEKAVLEEIKKVKPMHQGGLKESDMDCKPS